MNSYQRAGPARPDRFERGQVWLVAFEPASGREMRKERPAVIISGDAISNSPWELATVIPISTRDFNAPIHVKVVPPEGGLAEVSYVVCDYLRTMSHRRFLRYFGRLSEGTMREIEYRVTTALELRGM